MRIASLKRIVRLLSRPIADAYRVTTDDEIAAFAEGRGQNLWIEWEVQGHPCVSIWISRETETVPRQAAMRCRDGLFIGPHAVLAAGVIEVVAERVAKVRDYRTRTKKVSPAPGAVLSDATIAHLRTFTTEGIVSTEQKAALRKAGLIEYEHGMWGLSMAGLTEARARKIV